MNELQYKALCEACDRILLHASSNLYTKAIGWLHILNEHPVNLTKYDGVFHSGRAKRFNKIRSFLLTAKKLVQFKKTEAGWTSSNKLPAVIDVLLVSHIVSVEHIGVAKDFYYGTLGDALNENGLSSAIVLRNQSTGKIGNIAGKWGSKGHTTRIICDETLSVSEEWKIRKILKSQTRWIKSLGVESACEIDRNVIDLAQNETLSSLSIANLRFYFQMLRLISKLKPKSIVVTYEGHAWERLAFSAARKINKKIKCIGYQHTILFPKQHALKRSLGEDYDPDIILTTGSTPKSELEKSHNYKDVKVYSVGTHRREKSTWSLNHKYLMMKDLGCLVIPDGTYSECQRIFGFALMCAMRMPSLNFTFRLHPVLNFTDFCKKNPKFANLPSNIQMSKNELKDDMKAAGWCLYRGSGVVIQGVIAGLRPLYVCSNNDLNLDPLYELNSWRKYINSADQFCSVVEADLELNPDKLIRENLEARNYCIEYQEPIHVGNFINAIIRE